MNNWLNQLQQKHLKESLIRPHTKKAMAEFFSSIDREGSAIETLQFLHALIRLIKPRHILETGTWKGYATLAMASALQENGFGIITLNHLTKEKRDFNRLILFLSIARDLIGRVNLQSYIKKLITNLVCFHDTSPYFIEDKNEKKGRQKQYLNELDKIKKPHPVSEIEFTLSRGMRLWQLH